MQQCRSSPQEGHCACCPTKKSSAISFFHLWQMFMGLKIQIMSDICQETFWYIIFFGCIYVCLSYVLINFHKVSIVAVVRIEDYV